MGLYIGKNGDPRAVHAGGRRVGIIYRGEKQIWPGVPPGSFPGVKDVRFGHYRTMIVDVEDRLWMCGTDYPGVAPADKYRTTTFRPVPGMGDIRCADLGGTHAAAYKKDGTLWMFGRHYNTYDLFRDDRTLSQAARMEFVRIPIGSDYPHAFSGDRLFCAPAGTFIGGGNHSNGNGLWRCWKENPGSYATAWTMGFIDDVPGIPCWSGDFTLWSGDAGATVGGRRLQTPGLITAADISAFRNDENEPDTVGPTAVRSSGDWNGKNCRTIKSSPGAGIDGYTAVVTTDGSLYVAGRNLYGRFGGTAGRQEVVETAPWTDELSERRELKTYVYCRVEELSDVADVICGDKFIVAIKSDGTAWMSGLDAYGIFGSGDNIQRNAFTLIPETVGAARVFFGADRAAIVKSDGALLTSGYNYHSQLGLGDAANRNLFTRVELP